MLLLLLIHLCLTRHVSCFTGWVDPDTHSRHRHAVGYENNKEYKLVMSDEFDREGRTFKDGDDPRWTAISKSDDDQTAQGKKSLQFYNSSHVYTSGGELHILTTDDDTHWTSFNPYKKKYEKMTRSFASGMLQGWNKFCFTGGILEVDAQLPGHPHIGGLWPAVWLLGNLGRATYEESTNLMWPWSYDKCDRSLQHAQTISGCAVTEHFDMNPGQGRGATEIDILEVMPGEKGLLPIVKGPIERPYGAMTLQLAPGIPTSKKRPFSGTLPEWGFTWYDNLTYGVNVSINPFFYGNYLGATKALEPVGRSEKESYQCDAVGAMGNLGESHFKKMHRYRLEWEPGKDGYLRWYVDGKFKFGIAQAGLDKYGTVIPQEPSYIILNTAISTSWGFPETPPGCKEYDCKTTSGQCGFAPGFCRTLPAVFKIDSIRLYQNANNSYHSLGCNPKAFPTRKYIEANEDQYKRRFLDKKPLKSIKHGGGSCMSTKQCGEGWCTHRGRCECNHGWTGPFCLVPSYKSSEPDWDAETHWVEVEQPYVPSFLGWCAVIFFGSLFSSALAIGMKRRGNRFTRETAGLSWL